MIRIAALITALLCAAPLGAQTAAQAPGTPQAYGETLFRSGTSPRQHPVVAVAGGGSRLPASAASCAGCHGRDGSGRREGGSIAPDIRWPSLTQAGTRDREAGRSTPAYDETTLIRAITRGLDSAGNPLAAAMPRFELYPEDLDALIAYLKSMHLQQDPGIEAAQVRLGAVLPLTGNAQGQGRALRAVLQAQIADINTRGGLHGRLLVLEVEDAEGADASARLEALSARTLGLVAPYAPPLQSVLTAVARDGVPIFAPVTGPEALSLEPIFSTLPAARHVLGALAGFWSRLPETERGTLTVVLGKGMAAAALETHLRSVLPKAARVDFVPAAQMTAGTVTAAGWLLIDTAPGLLSQLGERLRGRRLLAASTSIAGLPGTLLSTAERIIVGAPLLPPRDDATIRQLEERLRQQKLEPPPAIVTIQALRGVALIEESLRRAGRELSRERLVQALEGISQLDTPGGPLAFGNRQRAGARGATLFAMDPSSGKLTLVQPWAAAL